MMQMKDIEVPLPPENPVDDGVVVPEVAEES